MKKIFLILFGACLGLNMMAEQNDYVVRCIAFYNLENLFDTIHDEGKNDYEYLPDGANHWGTMKYQNKLHNMAYAISQFGLDKTPIGAVCVGVSEVENIGCLNDLCAQPELAERGYKPILLEGPDRRGVDVGLLYNPTYFTPVGQPKGYELKAHYADGGVVRSRLQLLVSGYLRDDKGIVRDKIHIIVNHWPSRYGGEESSRATRDTAAMLTRHIADSIQMRDPEAKIIIMGDLNDDPTNHSCKDVLGARMNRRDVEPNGYFNCLWKIFDKGTGTLAYNGSWNFFDQIIVSEPLIRSEKPQPDRWSYWKGEMFNRPFLTVQEGKEKGTPLRTHKAGVWQNGYSDHYPTMIYLIKSL